MCMTKLYNSMDSNTYIVVHDKNKLIWEGICIELYMTKTFNNMNITHNQVNQLITHNIHKQIT